VPALEDPLSVGDCRLPNRLYRAPLLECAGNGPDAVETLVADLEPAAAAGAGLIFQGATIVTAEGGCAAPGMTRVHDPDFVERLGAVTDAVHDHGARIFLQLEHGGLRSMETWHAEFRREHPDLEQLAVSRPPAALRLLDRAGLLDYDAHVLSTAEIRELAAAFGRAAAAAERAGYDGIHLAGANMGIVQQFLSPFYNRRDDEFGGSPRARARFPELVSEEIRDRTALPVVTKVPCERPAPRWVRRRIDRSEAVWLADRLATAGFDALVPVETSVFWDMSVVRGAYPERAWRDERYRAGYAAAFGGPLRARAVAALNRLQSLRFDREPGWNADFCRLVRDRVDVPVLCEGGIRERGQIDDLLGDADPAADSLPAPACDAVGMARPFYAEPRLPARLLEAAPETRVACESCNNCAVPQATGAPGVCRTPAVLRERGRLEAAGAYDRDGDDG
jgi:2,4-dienoyl-CoA reductase-like NADH-dependent reductase (Old Yellow Enzyme family)